MAVDGNNVHGAYLIQWQDFLVRGERQRLGGYQLPLSEGIVDKRYTHVGALILKTALRNHALLFTTGMGGIDLPHPRMLKGLGWYLDARAVSVPGHTTGPLPPAHPASAQESRASPGSGSCRV